MDDLKSIITTDDPYESFDNQRHEQLVAALNAGASPNVLIGDNLTPIMYICEQYAVPKPVALLLNHGAEIDARDEYGQTALIRFVDNEHVVDYATDKKLIKDLYSPEGHKAKHYVELFRIFLERGADVNAQDDEGMTALMFCGENHEDAFFARQLLEAGANPNLLNERGCSALTIASGRQFYFLFIKDAFPVIDLLVENTSQELAVPADGITPMVAAIKGTCLQAFRALVAAGYAITLTPPFQHLEPIAAVFAGDKERLQQALRSGHAIEAKTDSGLTPLMIAALLGHKETVEYLLEAGAELEAIGRLFGRYGSALFAAVLGNHLDICQFLLERGAKPIIESVELKNVLELALWLNDKSPSQEYLDLCRFLWITIKDKIGVDLTFGTARELKTILSRKNHR